MTDQNDLLTQLTQEARRLRVARKLPEGELSLDWILRVVADFKKFMSDHGLSLADVSRKMGKGHSPSTLSMFSGIKSIDEYAGDVQGLTRRINQFMETYAQAREVPRPAGFVETEIARRILTVIKNTIETRAIGVIFGDAGRGKTMTLQAAAQIYHQGVLVRVRRSTMTPTGLARALASALRIKGRTLFDLEEKLIDTLKGSDRPIMIDEAQQLSMAGLELLRDLHDECDIPIVLVGTKSIDDKCRDTDQFFGQMSSRISLQYDITEGVRDGGSTRPLTSVNEIIKVWGSDTLRFTDDGALLMAKIANILGGGGLRRCSRILYIAVRLAPGKPISADIIFDVLNKMRSREDIGALEDALHDLKVKVA